MNAHVSAFACLHAFVCVYVHVHWIRARECILGPSLIRRPESDLAPFSFGPFPFHFTNTFFHFVSPCMTEESRGISVSLNVAFQ